MKFLSVFILLLWACIENIINGQATISYSELEELNARCSPEDSCSTRESEDSPGITSNACSCDRLCSQFDTCCIDSPYRSITPPELTPACRKTPFSMESKGYFIVDRCPHGGNVSPEWKSLCRDEWNGEDDVMKLVPVTSLFSSITYKNYFCFKCHELGDDFFYWNIRVEKVLDNDADNANDSDVESGIDAGGKPVSSRHVELAYDNENQVWKAPVGNDSIPNPVVLRFEIPLEIRSLAVECEAEVISNCSTTWNDTDVSSKCNLYTAILYIHKDGSILKYKNAHCALCNFESLDGWICKSSYKRRVGGGGTGYSAGAGRYGGWGHRRRGYGGGNRRYGGGGYKRYGGGGSPVARDEELEDDEESISDGAKKEREQKFSFMLLLNINRESYGRSGRKQKCEGNFLWDPYAEKCRKRTCAFPGYVIKNGSCSPK